MTWAKKKEIWTFGNQNSLLENFSVQFVLSLKQSQDCLKMFLRAPLSSYNLKAPCSCSNKLLHLGLVPNRCGVELQMATPGIRVDQKFQLVELEERPCKSSGNTQEIIVTIGYVPCLCFPFELVLSFLGISMR
ncbi:hypothetical protein Tco_0598384 [Tanacetum coccineum]